MESFGVTSHKVSPLVNSNLLITSIMSHSSTTPACRLPLHTHVQSWLSVSSPGAQARLWVILGVSTLAKLNSSATAENIFARLAFNCRFALLIYMKLRGF